MPIAIIKFFSSNACTDQVCCFKIELFFKNVKLGCYVHCTCIFVMLINYVHRTRIKCHIQYKVHASKLWNKELKCTIIKLFIVHVLYLKNTESNVRCEVSCIHAYMNKTKKKLMSCTMYNNVLIVLVLHIYKFLHYWPIKKILLCTMYIVHASK